MNINAICCFLDLDINNINIYTKDDVKQHFKKIALECHPDKLSNIKDEIIKNEKIERFKNASIAYNQLLQDFEKYGKIMANNEEYNYDNFSDDFDIFKDISQDFWYDAIDTLMKNNDKTKLFTETFHDVASFFIKSGSKCKSSYKPSTHVIKHNITLPVSFYDLYTTKKKKVRLILKNIYEPIFINIICSKEYPIMTKQFIDDDGIEHEIILKMVICNSCKDTKYITHNIRDNVIDLIANIEISLLDYLIGCKKGISYVSGETINIEIPSFTNDKIILKKYGLCGGDFIIYIKLHYISKDEWKLVNQKDKNDLINILRKVC